MFSCKGAGEDGSSIPGVSGVIKSGMTGKPVTGTVVTLKKGANAIASTTAGTDGSYSFTGIEAGAGYTVTASASIYKTTEHGFSFDVSDHRPGVDIMLERNWPASGTLVAGTVGSPGSASNQLSFPIGMAFGPDGALYIVDAAINKIRKVTPGDETITNVAGTGIAGSAGGSALGAATFNGPNGICFASNNDIYVTDATGNLVRKISGGIVSTVAGNGAASSAMGATALTSSIWFPREVAAIGSNIYITSRSGHSILKLSGTSLSVIAGNGIDTGGTSTGDGGPAAAATVDRPLGLTAGPDGSLYFVESRTKKVRQIDPAGNISVLAAGFTNPDNIAVDAAGIVYVTDIADHSVLMIRGSNKIKVAGGTTGEGLGDLAGPRGVAIGPDGYLYIADSGNSRIVRY